MHGELQCRIINHRMYTHQNQLIEGLYEQQNMSLKHRERFENNLG